MKETFIVLTVCLSLFGIETTSFVAILASAGLAIGSALSSSTIDNCSQEYRRADVAMSVSYDADLDSTRAALERAMQVEGALAECPAGTSHVYLLDLTLGGKANYQVRVWCNGADYWAVRERVTAQCKRELDKWLLIIICAEDALTELY